MSDQSMIDPTLSGLSGSQGQLRGSMLQRSNGVNDNTHRLLPASSLLRVDDDILRDYNLAVERAQTWTGLARFGFNAMLATPEYKNKLRLKPDKMARIVHFLTIPNAKSREKDRVDAQIKHQAQQWFYHDGLLFRKESRLEHPRRHVSADEVFDILTAEHLRSNHHGRDKMLKVLEAKYIGYTKDELMYVIDHCLICSSKHIRGAAARRREHRNAGELENELDGALDEMTS